jgi:hypothetical protein
MLGHRRTVPLWRQKRASPFAIERSLSQRRLTGTNVSSVETAVLSNKMAQRKILNAKHRVRLSDA